jgi:hypothetical protein
VASHKTLDAKVVGNGDMHNPAKYGAKIQKFALSEAKTLAHFPQNPSKLVQVAHFYEGFFMKMLIDHVSYFYS